MIRKKSSNNQSLAATRNFARLAETKTHPFLTIRKELLDSGGNFEDDERVSAMCDSMNEKLFPTPAYCAVCAPTKSWHTRPLENRLRENPAYVDHEFVAGVVAR